MDLYPSVGGKGEAYSMRHNKIDDLYEIFDFKHSPDPYTDEAVQYSDPDIEQVIDEAYRLETQAEGHSSFEYGHTRLHCPEEVFLDDFSDPFE
ncbi:hypothetical protein OB919_15945 [Halobacteria archaeon AArc-curdl1]|uniref:Uncharacterized protein n=1 Tax=Natronosalvus hydrolyticus TaxID=2979988 RepID=A0AAP2ZAA8_9EURY|nr:hypothetical protein [Halobacteria archaeon AArc-curdl1]